MRDYSKNLVEFDLSQMPMIQYADYGFSNKPILHVDRTSQNEVLLFILTGCMPVVEDEIEYFLEAGDVFFLKQGLHHYGRTLFAPGTSWYYIHFTHDIPDENMEEITENYYHKQFVNFEASDYKRKITLPKQLHGMNKTDILDKFKKIVEMFNSRNPFQIAYVNSTLHQLLTDIYMIKARSGDANSPQARVNKLTRYMTVHISDPFDSTDIENYMELSYKYIGELFKKNTGFTIHEYFMQMKIDKATKMLGGSSISITEVSEALGFSDPLYFSNVFKKYTGMSPRNFRKG